MKTPREVAEDVLAKEPWATALWDREAAIALVVEAVEESRREVAELTNPAEPQTIEVGDQVKLTGECWAGYPYHMQNEVVSVVAIINSDPVILWEGEHYRVLKTGFSGTKVED